MHVESIGWVGVLIEDFEAALDFFSGTLGLALEYRDEVKMLAHFRLRSGQLLEVYGPSNRQRKEKYRWFDGPALGFEVEDIELARQEMMARGARFITEIETWADEAWSMFLGPEDKLFEILLPKRRYPMEASQVLKFSWAGIGMQDFGRAISFFSEVMEMPLAQRDDVRGSAHFWLPAGHLFEIFGPNSKQGQLMSHTTIAFEVEDVGQVRTEMKEMGVEFVANVETSSYDKSLAYFRGPGNYLYVLWKPSKPG